MNDAQSKSPEDLIRLDPRFQRGVELFNGGAWYEAHDVLEDLWHETADPDRRVLALLRQRVSQRLEALQQEEDPASCPVPMLIDRS